MTLTTFTKGIMGGVPSDMVVAHKFGENTNYLNSGIVANHELHDCGIVYYSNHPYLLCVMTRGTDLSALQGAIEDISRTAYKSIDAFYLNQSKVAATTTPSR